MPEGFLEEPLLDSARRSGFSPQRVVTWTIACGAFISLWYFSPDIDAHHDARIEALEARIVELELAAKNQNSSGIKNSSISTLDDLDLASVPWRPSDVVDVPAFLLEPRLYVVVGFMVFLGLRIHGLRRMLIEFGEGADVDTTALGAVAAETEEPQGNIYRLLAVIGPEDLGMWGYIKTNLRALLAMFMQLYLPYRMLVTVVSGNACVGMKLPMFYVRRTMHEVLLIPPVFNLVALFTMRTAEEITAEANRCYRLLSRTKPLGVERACEAKSNYRIPESIQGHVEAFWVCVSLFVTFYSATMVQIVMFFKVATFNEEIQTLVVNTMALLWVNDLDEAVMKANPELDRMYKEEVKLQTVAEQEKPKWIKEVTRLTKPMMKCLYFLGFTCVLLTYWIATTRVVTTSPGAHVGI